MNLPACHKFPLKRRAFTLVELLVVVAIIALLFAVLIPVVSRARDTARASVCANNMREIAQATRRFADENDGRGPTCFPGGLWQDVLSAEVFARTGSKYGVNIHGAPAGPNVKTLSCPKWVVRSAIRPYAMNEYLVGPIGASERVPDDPKRHIAGYYVPEAIVNRNPPAGKKTGDSYTYFDINGPTAVYFYGPKLSRFSPSQILLVEHDWGNDWIRGYDTPARFNRDGTPPEPTGPGYADWVSATSSGALSFRHPYYGKANFARFDGAVEMLGINDGGNLTARYKFQ